MSHLVQIYPNPSEGKFYIDLDIIDTKAQVDIYDVAGKQLVSFITRNGSAGVDMNDYESGIYFVKVSTKMGTTTKKMVLNK